MQNKLWKIIPPVLFVVVFFATLVEAQEQKLEIRELLKRDFEPVIEELAKSQVPIRLPSYLSGYDWDGATSNQIYYPHLLEVRPELYYLSIDGAPNCSGSTSCRFSRFKAEAVGGFPPALSNLIEENGEGRLVTLTNQKIQAVFLPSECGMVGCTDTKIIFDLDGVRYTFGSKGGRAEPVIKAANSLILNPITESDY